MPGEGARVASVRVLDGDSRLILPTLATGSVDAAVFDPPYGTGNSRRIAVAKGDWRFTKERAAWDQWHMWWLPEVLRIATGAVVFFCPSTRLREAIAYAERRKIAWRLLSWCKTNARPSFSGGVAWAMEPLIAMRELQPAACADWFPDTLPHNGPEPTGHQHQKPIAVMQWAVRIACPVGGTVLDCFAGSGTTGEAALGTGRNAVLIENDPHWVRVSRERAANHAPLFADVRACKRGRCNGTGASGGRCNRCGSPVTEGAA